MRKQEPHVGTCVYEVEFVDGGHAEFGANAIVENMYAQWDMEGNQFHLMDCMCGPQEGQHGNNNGKPILHNAWKKTTTTHDKRVAAMHQMEG